MADTGWAADHNDRGKYGSSLGHVRRPFFWPVSKFQLSLGPYSSASRQNMGKHILMAKNLASAVFIALLCAQGAKAEPVSLAKMTLSYSYFNKVGSSLEDHNRDLKECVSTTRGVISFAEAVNGPSIISSLVDSGGRKGAISSAIENCMLVKRWRVVALPELEGKAFSEYSSSDLAKKLEPWIGASEPYGQIVRSWKNDAANGTNDLSVPVRPPYKDGAQLSFLAADIDPVNRNRTDTTTAAPTQKMINGKLLKPGQSSKTPDGEAIIVIGLKGVTTRSYHVMLGRVAEAAALDDRKANTIFVSRAPISRKNDGLWAFAVPAGTWRVRSFGNSIPITLCLGSPAFEVKAGETVYAGTFDLSGESIGPDLKLSAIESWAKDQGVASDIKPASYKNGSTETCVANVIYALEIDGAP